MKYERTEYFDGDSVKAIDIAKNTFLPNGFQIISCNESDLEVVGPGIFWMRGQNPWIGVSKAFISIKDKTITLGADLGGVAKIIKYIAFFILCMVVFFILLFGLLFYVWQGQPLGKIILISIAPFIPWPFIFPLLGIWLKKRTFRGLDILLNNMISVVDSSKTGLY